VDFEHKLIDLGNKPSEFVNKYAAAPGSYGTAKVPLLEYNGDGVSEQLVVESDVVTRFVAQHVEGSDKKKDIDLLPYDQQGRIDSFLGVWESVVSTYYAVLTSSSQKQVTQSLKRFQGALDKLEDTLNDKDDDTPFVCAKFSVAECVAAPWVQRFFVTLPYYRNIDFEDDILNDRYPTVQRWMEAVRTQPSVMASMCPEDEMKAAAERYYVSFVTPGAPATL